jgi:hypothetical protein
VARRAVIPSWSNVITSSSNCHHERAALAEREGSEGSALDVAKADPADPSIAALSRDDTVARRAISRATKAESRAAPWIIEDDIA